MLSLGILIPAEDFGLEARLQQSQQPPAKHFVYGVCEHTLTEEDAQAMDQLGIDMQRIDFLWYVIEPSKGDWHFEYYDGLVKRAKEHDLGLLAVLVYSTEWASSAPPEAEHRKFYPPNLEDYATFVEKTVERYKDDITYWQIWNEPNWEGFWKPKPNASHYTMLLKQAYKAAKKANPQAKIVFGGTARVDLEFIRQVYENGGKDFFDILTVHPYRQPRSPYSYPTLEHELNQLKELMQEYSDQNKDVWLTEIGWHTKGPGSVSPAIQALYLRETFDIIKSIRNVNSNPAENNTANNAITNNNFIDALFWYELRDPGTNPEDKEDNHGLLQYNYEPKPAFYTYQEIIEESNRSNETGEK